MSTPVDARLVLERWLGPQLAVAHAPIQPEALEMMWPQERAHVQGAVHKRRCEFATARMLARRCLRELGCAEQALVPNPDRSPRWPEGIVGSITHSNADCVVVAGQASRWRSVGIDIEQTRVFSPGMVEMVLTPQERARIGDAQQDCGQRDCLLRFCLKEAFYKFQSPLTGLFLDFQDVQVCAGAGPEAWSVRAATDASERATQAFAQLGAPCWPAHATWLGGSRVLAAVAATHATLAVS